MRSGNVLPGTIVDTEIASRSFYDFYLVSQGGLVGTVKPTRYVVLLDELGLTADEVQGLTYWLCYTYGSCTRTVGLVSAKACLLGRAGGRARVL